MQHIGKGEEAPLGDFRSGLLIKSEHQVILHLQMSWLITGHFSIYKSAVPFANKENSFRAVGTTVNFIKYQMFVFSKPELLLNFCNKDQDLWLELSILGAHLFRLGCISCCSLITCGKRFGRKYSPHKNTSEEYQSPHIEEIQQKPSKTENLTCNKPFS